jgi:RNA polymerase sigma-54 factor
MGLELRQQLKLSQQLVMTPQLQQAIKLLQLSRTELLERVEQEILENPALEFKEDNANPEQQASDQQVEAKSEEYRPMEMGEADLVKNANWEDYLGLFSTASGGRREYEALEDLPSYENRVSAGHTLASHLLWQLHLTELTPAQKKCGEVIIGNLGPNGYLLASNEELAVNSGQDPKFVEEMVTIIQGFDPVGVAARTASECLMAQLKSLGEEDPILLALVREHLEDIQACRFKPLLRKFKITQEDLETYIGLIRELDPLPGNDFSAGTSLYISPDIYVYKDNGEFIIQLNDDDLPHLQLNQYYMEAFKGRQDQAKEYFQDKVRSAVWLMKSLYQRQLTLYRVMESILKFQREFFEHGVSQLKPLILKDVAEDIEMHESTVSRVTSNKYVSTPYGLFELKFFFNSALGRDNGEQVGSQSVKALIKELIEDEDPKRPLSDEKIAAVLKKRLGVNIARRTVAKYRTGLQLPSSSKRKRVF